jgi:hypothetical protein
MTRSPDYERTRAMQEAQTQPPTAYINQLSAPGTLQGVVTFIGQTVLGTDTLSQSFHPLFQDPHASTGDKWKAAGIGGFTLVTDVVTIASLVTLQPEIAEGARAADVAVLAIDDAGHVAANGASDEVLYRLGINQAKIGGSLADDETNLQRALMAKEDQAYATAQKFNINLRG